MVFHLAALTPSTCATACVMDVTYCSPQGRPQIQGAW